MWYMAAGVCMILQLLKLKPVYLLYEFFLDDFVDDRVSYF